MGSQLHRALLLAAITGSAHADVGVRLGARGGAEVRHDADLSLAADLRLAFSRSPLTINPAFDYFVDEDKTQFQIAVNALYHLAVVQRLDAYGGVGVGVTTFTFNAGVPADDDHGSRLGLNLLAGVCFDLPVVAPYAQVMTSLGEIDLVAISGGLLVALGGDRQWDTCGRRRSTGVQP